MKAPIQVIIIDRDPVFIEEVKDLLNHGRYQTAAYTRIPEDAEEIREQHPDVIMIDLGMQEQRTLDFIRELKRISEKENIAIIAFSDDLSDREIAELKEHYGIRAFYVKTHNPRELRDIVLGMD
jgi:DNA-binding NarL/FixJ family response regulator